MKTLRKISLGVASVLALIWLSSGNIMAQRGEMQGRQHEGSQKSKMEWLDLTDAQENQIKPLRIDHQKKMLTHRNLMDEKQAALKTQMTADQPNTAAIDKLVEEIGQLHTKMEKDKVGHRLAVRQLLTSEQKVMFDSHMQREHRGGNKPMGQHKGRHND